MSLVQDKLIIILTYNHDLLNNFCMYLMVHLSFYIGDAIAICLRITMVIGICSVPWFMSCCVVQHNGILCYTLSVVLLISKSM